MLKFRLFTITLLLFLLHSFCFGELEGILSRGQITLKKLGEYKRALALDMARELNNPQLVELLRTNLSPCHASVELVPLLKKANTGDRGFQQFFSSVRKLDEEILRIKGIAERVDTLLEIRLAFPTRGFPKANDLLVSYIPSGNEKSWKYIEAFDIRGGIHHLDVYQPPKGQVLVVGLNARKDLRAGIALMNEELRKAGMQPSFSQREGLKVAKLDYIYLKDDKEPWISGDAEIYALVNGISPQSEKASVIAVDMPYLDHDKTNYYPNQVLIVWNNYRYKAANINLYEHDDSANYKQIVAMLIKEIGKVVPEYQYIAEIASKIVQLMPNEWFTNDDDYVDVYYTLEQGKSYTNYQGVSRNAKMTLVPYVIPEKNK